MRYARGFGVFLALLILIGSWPLTLSAQTLTRGPYLQLGTSTSIIVRWRTDQATDAVVTYGVTLGNLTASATSGSLTTDHAVAVTGLQPDTRYYYAVGTSSITLTGGDASHRFVSAPLPATAKPTRIWVIGDSGTANANAAAVRNAYKTYTGTRGTEVWLMLGDNAYPSGTDAEYQAAVFAMYPELLRQVVLWPTLGNHDGMTANSTTQTGPYYNIFTLPTAGEAGGVASGTEAYYSFDYANIHFICLDSYGTDRSPNSPMLMWLLNDLQSTDKTWMIAFWHHPPYTKGSHDSDVESQLIDMRQNALPILEAYGVDLVLTGHSHSYERSFLIDGHYGASGTWNAAMALNGGDGRESGDGAYTKSSTLQAPHEGAVYAVAGSSGKISGGLLNHPAMFISLNTLGSMALDVYGNRLDAVFLDASGNVSDSFTMLKGSDTLPPAVTLTQALDDITVSVTFSEQVDVVSAETAQNYNIDQGVVVLQAVLDSSGRTVLLTTSLLTEGIPYTLTLHNVSDLIGNPVAPNTQTSFTFVNNVSKSFQNGVAPTSAYTGTRDTTLAENEPTNNFGNASDLRVDGDDPGGTGQDVATLIAWDITAIPFDALVESVTMTFNVTNPSSGLYNIYALTRPWQEAEATWDVAAANNPWNIPGAQGPGDRGTTLLGTVSASTIGTYATQLNPDGVALVQGWIDGTAVNYGLIMASTSTTDGADFTSSDTTTATNRPKLTVTYTVPPSGDDVTPPTAPTNLQVLGQSATTTTLGWQPAFDDVGVSGYKVYRDSQVVALITTTSYEDSGLAPETAYDYAVTAYDAAGNESLASNTVTVVTESAPALTVSVVDMTIQLQTAGKKRLYATAQVTVVNQNAQPVANATVFSTWSGLVSDTVSALTGGDGRVIVNSPKVPASSTGQFVLTVDDVSAPPLLYDPAANLETSDCVDTTGTSCSSGPGVPPAPTGLTATATTNAITLAWDNNPDPTVTTYKVYRSTISGTGYVAYATTSTSDYVDTNATAGTTYYYVVTALNAVGNESSFSAEAAATVNEGPPVIMQVAAVVVTVSPDRKHWRGTAEVMVVDAVDDPVEAATVTGSWTFEPQGGAVVPLGSTSAPTDTAGTAVLTSPKQRAVTGDIFRFTVTTVSRPGASYEPGPTPASGFGGVP